MSGFSELEVAHQAHAARAREAFEQLAQEAAALEHRQARYEALQVRPVWLRCSECTLDTRDAQRYSRAAFDSGPSKSTSSTCETVVAGSSVHACDACAAVHVIAATECMQSVP